MPPKQQHPDAYHTYLYPETKQVAPREIELENWLERVLGAPEADPIPELHEI